MKAALGLMARLGVPEPLIGDIVEASAKRSRLWLWIQALSAIARVLASVTRERMQMPAQPLAAVIHALLITPAALFIGAVVLRRVPALQDTAQGLVLLYAGRGWTLWLLLLALPMVVLTSGCIAVYQERIADRKRTDHPTVVTIPLSGVFVKALTALSAAILATVILHMLAT